CARARSRSRGGAPRPRQLLGTDSSSLFSLGLAGRGRLAEWPQRGAARARRSGAGTLATLSMPLPASVDPSAVASASRRPGEPWFVFEQPDRGRTALAGLGAAVSLQASGKSRFTEV